MRAVDATHGVPQGRGRRARLRHPRRREPARPTTRSTTPASATSRSRHEQGARPRGRGLREGLRQGRRRASPPPGPGATNLVTPIADAMMDSVPTVFITGQVRTDLIGTDGFQEADIIGITMPVVKHSFHDQRPARDPASTIHEAFHIARTGRPGPVLVDIPQDLSRADIDYEPRHRAVRPARLQADRPRATSSRSGSPPRRSPTRGGR